MRVSNRHRRRRPKGRRLVPLRPPTLDPACGCSQLAVIDFDAVCGDCGEHVRDRVVVPTSGQPGDTRKVGASCPCGGDAVGAGVVVEILPS